jgi:hypothetical protein
VARLAAAQAALARATTGKKTERDK